MSGSNKSTKLPTFFLPLYSIFTLGFIYFFPRAVVSFFGEDSPWSSYFYQYGLGFLFFFTGIIIIRKSGACIPGRGNDTRWLTYLWLGLALYAAMHAGWILLALNYPFKGDLI